jgi:zinc protease
MKKLIVAGAVLVALHQAVAQKEVALPKDLPAYGPERTFGAPNVTTSKLENGLTVWLVSEPGFPKIALSIGVRGGLAADPNDRPGLSQLLGDTLDQGTKTHSAKTIAQEFQAAGGDLTIESGKDSTVLSVGILSAGRDSALALLSDLVQNATFPDAEVALAKRNAADNLRQRESEPSFIATRAISKVLFGDNPYHVVAPTQASISASTPDDLRKIYVQRFRPDQALFVAVGDFASGNMLDAVKARFNDWKAPASAPLPSVTSPAGAPTHAIYVVPRPGSVQTTLELGTFGPVRSDLDYVPALIANSIYGGTFGSRLVENIREDKGYTYSPFASLQTYRATGVLITRADVRNEVTAPSLNEILYELNRLATTSPTREELGRAKRYLVGIEAIQLQSRSAVSRELARYWVNGLPPEEISAYGRKVAATTSDEVNSAARKYFPAARTAIVAVGEEKVVRDALAPFGIPLQDVPR